MTVSNRTMAGKWAVVAITLVALATVSGCSRTGDSSHSASAPSGVDQEYERLTCIAVPEDLRWEYSYLYDSNGQLKPLSAIKSMTSDQTPSPAGDITVLYKTLESRYGHPPACGEPYPKGPAGQLNIDILNHKALSCADIPSDLKQRYADLFESNGQLKSWKTIASTPIASPGVSLDHEVTTLYNEVVARLGHPISCPQN
ncbi:hypothetical protein GPX89_02390 [Nocardia sp. ET3-3]|uniref:Lipoprotein n=1 Tax=Nocardia terrae TaxID=2675851 RepID=A0A7K1UP42_9NOCA|nr:hypothetical protein [Nocardia terrae]MVU76091.1 hypothetical protein [Nocardia terrae]